MLSLRLFSLLLISFAVSSSLPIISNEITEGSAQLREGSGESATIESVLDSTLEGSGEGSGDASAQIEGSGESVAAIITRLLSEWPFQFGKPITIIDGTVIVEGSGESA